MKERELTRGNRIFGLSKTLLPSSNANIRGFDSLQRTQTDATAKLQGPEQRGDGHKTELRRPEYLRHALSLSLRSSLADDADAAGRQKTASPPPSTATEVRQLFPFGLES